MPSLSLSRIWKPSLSMRICEGGSCDMAVLLLIVLGAMLFRFGRALVGVVAESPPPPLLRLFGVNGLLRWPPVARVAVDW